MTYDDISSTEFLASLPMVDAKRIGCVGYVHLNRDIGKKGKGDFGMNSGIR